MKSLQESLFDKNLADKDITTPREGTTCYDYYGEPWEILDVVKTNISKSRLLNWCESFDDSGAMAEDIKFDYNSIKKNYEYLVACNSEYGGRAVWVWGEEGVCYTNK